MKDLMKKLEEAYNLLSNIPVSGQAVDAMYGARLKIRMAYQMAETMNEETEEVKQDG